MQCFIFTLVLLDGFSETKAYQRTLKMYHTVIICTFLSKPKGFKKEVNAFFRCRAEDISEVTHNQQLNINILVRLAWSGLIWLGWFKGFLQED